MSKRIVLAALAGGVLVFIVSGILHSTRLGEVGIRALPNEDLLMSAMRGSMPEAGFYFFPAPNFSSMSNASKQSQYLAKYKQGPTGILMYKPGGEELRFGKLLGIQFAIGLIAAFTPAWILGITASATRYSTRVHIVILIGLFAEFYINVPYWNWYGFPMNYVMGHLIGGVLSWAIAGLAMAAIVERPSTVSKIFSQKRREA